MDYLDPPGRMTMADHSDPSFKLLLYPSKFNIKLWHPPLPPSIAYFQKKHPNPMSTMAVNGVIKINYPRVTLFMEKIPKYQYLSYYHLSFN